MENQMESADQTTTEAAKPKKRRTPTEKQIEALSQLDDDALVAKALDAVICLDRRAKAIWDHRNEHRRASFADALSRKLEDIHVLKNQFVDAMVLAGKAKVFSFEVEEQDGWYCESCVRRFRSRNPECYTCGCDADPYMDVEDSYIIDCGGHYRFHEPYMPDAVAALATKIPGHEPTQPQLEIPEIELTAEAQNRCVKMATERLRASRINPDKRCPECGHNQLLVLKMDEEEQRPYRLWVCENCDNAMSAETDPPDECSECGGEEIDEVLVGDFGEAAWQCLECGSETFLTHWETGKFTIWDVVDDEDEDALLLVMTKQPIAATDNQV